MKIHRNVVVLWVSVFVDVTAHTQPKKGWELAFYLGTSFSKSETLTIQQQGYPDITLHDAAFSTKPFNAPPY